MRKLLVSGLLLIKAILVTAQGGLIKGTITDAKTNESLIGTTVLIQGTTTGTITDFDGRFIIPKVAPGTYNMVISFVSYETQILKAVVSENQETILDIRLEPATLDIGEVKVTAKRRTDTDVSMLNTLKASGLIVSGISAQQISKSPDKDAAEVIRRVPGITITDGRFVIVRGLSERYNSVLVNGATAPSSEADVRAFSFDVIPSNLIENILIFKTPAPELPADFAGAAINIATKNTADENSFLVSYSTGYQTSATFKNFRTQKGGKTDWLGFDDGTRALPSSYPSTEKMAKLYEWYEADEIAGKKAELTTIAKDFDNSLWKINSKKAIPEQNFNAVFTRRFTIGKVTGSNITSVNYGYKETYNQRSKHRYYAPDTASVSPVEAYNYSDDYYDINTRLGVVNNWLLVFGKNNKIEFRNFFNQMGKSTVIERNGLDYYTSSIADTLRDYQMSFQSRSTYSGQLAGSFGFRENQTKLDFLAGYSYANRKEPDIKRLSSEKYYSDDPDDPNNGIYRLTIQNEPVPEYGGRLYLNTEENIVNGAANLEHIFTVSQINISLKAGVFYEHKERDFSARKIGIITTRNFSQDLFTPFDELLADDNFYADGGFLYKEKTNPNDSYKVSANLKAGYAGLKIPFIHQKASLYSGVRIENYSRLLSDFQSDKTASPDIEYSTTDIFPSANLSWNITEKQLIRFAYGRTINRPEFREVAPFAFIDFEKSATVYGNTELKSAYADNFDLRYEWYPSATETFSLALFYKDFKNPIETFLIPSGNGWDYKPFNTENAYSRGIEIDLRKSFAGLEESGSFLRYFSHLTAVFNASVIQSEITTDLSFARERHRELQGQSPYIVNLGLYYENSENGLLVSANYNVIGKKIIAVGARSADGVTTTPHTWEMPRNLFDLTINKKLGKNITVKAGIKDLFNEPVKQLQYEDVVLKNNIKVIEQETINYKPGMTITTGITFIF